MKYACSVWSDQHVPVRRYSSAKYAIGGHGLCGTGQTESERGRSVDDSHVAFRTDSCIRWTLCFVLWLSHMTFECLVLWDYRLTTSIMKSLKLNCEQADGSRGKAKWENTCTVKGSCTCSYKVPDIIHFSGPTSPLSSVDTATRLKLQSIHQKHDTNTLRPFYRKTSQCTQSIIAPVITAKRQII